MARPKCGRIVMGLSSITLGTCKIYAFAPPSDLGICISTRHLACLNTLMTWERCEGRNVCFVSSSGLHPMVPRGPPLPLKHKDRKAVYGQSLDCMEVCLEWLLYIAIAYELMQVHTSRDQIPTLYDIPSPA